MSVPTSKRRPKTSVHPSFIALLGQDGPRNSLVRIYAYQARFPYTAPPRSPKRNRLVGIHGCWTGRYAWPESNRFSLAPPTQGNQRIRSGAAHQAKRNRPAIPRSAQPVKSAEEGPNARKS